MITKSKNIQFADITLAHNTRLPIRDKEARAKRLDIRGLAASIMEDGTLLQAIMVEALTGGGVGTLQGMRRYLAVEYICDTHPDQFKRIFDKGVPCTLVSGIDAEQRAKLINDDGNKLSHSSDVELLLSAAPMHKAGTTRERMAVALNGILNAVKGPIKGKRAEKISTLETEKLKAESPEAKSALQKEIDSQIAESRTGTIQWIQDVLSCPKVVFDTLVTKETKEHPEGYEADYVFPVSVTHARIKKLATIAKGEYLEDVKYTPKAPGPKFNVEWGILQDEFLKNVKGADTPRPKSVSSDKLKELGGKCDSVELKTLLNSLSDSKDASENGVNIIQIDGDLQIISTIRKGDPEFYKQVVRRYAELSNPVNPQG
tara:strand:+ start:896 stop:2014 length:1119 start_codon:yes stop_codon:yes gene_type:complete